MKTAITVILLAMSGITAQSCKKSIAMEAPDAAKKPKELTIHGDTRIDNYYWLRERDNPEVIAYLQAENAYRERMMKGSEKLEKSLYREIIGRIKQTDMSVPYKENGYYYYERYEEGKEYPIYCRKRGSLDAEEEVIANVNRMAEGYSYYEVEGITISPDNRYAAMGIDTLSRRKYSIVIRDLGSGEMLDDMIPVTDGWASWANDNRTIFYSRLDDMTLRNKAIYRHTLGTAASGDVLVFEETDETYNVTVSKSKSKEYIFITSSSIMTTEERVLSADNPEGDFRIIQPRERGLEYSSFHFEDHFYILTNLDAINFRLMKTPVDRTGKEYWEEVIPHREDVFLENIVIFRDWLVVNERREGLNHLRVIRWQDGEEHYVDMGEEVYTAWISVNAEFDTEMLRFGYSSLTTPVSTYDYNLESHQKILLKQQEVLGDFDPANYETRRIYALAGDGKKIPMSIVYRKGLKLDGNNPTLLYGYGSYGINEDPFFSSPRLSLLDRGFIFAMAHVRGSQIYGRPWYEEGKLLNKMNTFTDFNSCAEHLIREKSTCPEKLFASGGSAGGLLIGAVINMRPDLYHGVIASVPFVDVVTTMLDDDIPLTTGEYDEWGNPNQEEYYRYMLSYSPYDQVKAQDYPNILVTTGLHDSQVQYWEPAKWVAKLRDMKTDDNLLLMYCNMDTGHSGASGRFEMYKNTAMEYAFLLTLAGIKK
jgi:oligopeptidase B